MNQPPLFKLHLDPNSRGLRCDGEGLFLAGEPLLKRDRDGRFRSRPSAEIKKILNGAYSITSEWASRVRSADVVANALNKGDLARATMAAVLMRLPEPDKAIPVTEVDGMLAKAGFNPGESRDNHGRWARDGDSGAHLAAAQLALLEPIEEPFLIEMLRPFPGTIDVVPPITGFHGRNVPPPTNPYPGRPECVEEWTHAREFCERLRREGKIGKDGYRGFGLTMRQCLMGQVSEECGGNPVLHG